MEAIEYYQNSLEEFQTALESEFSFEEQNHEMIKLLKLEIDLCLNYIEELS